ncbi:MAG: hypothetical protein AAF447_23305, partial [Myxococcota bacterium]
MTNSKLQLIAILSCALAFGCGDDDGTTGTGTGMDMDIDMPTGAMPRGLDNSSPMASPTSSEWVVRPDESGAARVCGDIGRRMWVVYA